MAIPDFQSCMRPLLAHIEDGRLEHFLKALDAVYVHFGLTDEEINELLPSGKQTKVKNRCGWARTYMKKAGLLTQPQRGHIQITEAGRKALKDCPDRITVRYLKDTYPEFAKFHASKPEAKTTTTIQSDEETDPSERLQTAYEEIKFSLAAELLETVKNNSWQFFEKLVVEMMIAMGYGGSRAESGKATQYTNDDGIDGIINEDKLGLDTIYLQAKKWENVVQRPEIDKFIGALTRQGARKGVFITTSSFSSGARDASTGLNMSIVLIDGKQLADLMIEYDLGVNTKETFRVKDIDTDYFSED